MPIIIDERTKRYTPEEVAAMYASGEIRRVNPEDSAERIQLAGMAGGVRVPMRVRMLEQGRDVRAWREPDLATLRERATKASRSRASVRRKRGEVVD